MPCVVSMVVSIVSSCTGLAALQQNSRRGRGRPGRAQLCLYCAWFDWAGQTWQRGWRCIARRAAIASLGHQHRWWGPASQPACPWWPSASGGGCWDARSVHLQQPGLLWAGLGSFGLAICGSVAPSPRFCRACWAPAAGALCFTALEDHNWCGRRPSHPPPFSHHCCLLLPATATTCPCLPRRPQAELNAWLAQHSAERSVQRLNNKQSVTTDPLREPQRLFDPHQQGGPAAGTPPCGPGFIGKQRQHQLLTSSSNTPPRL